MTGHGDAAAVHAGLRITAEIRSVNNRFLKFSTRLSSIVENLESQVETLLRETIKRGTVTVQVRVQATETASRYELNGPTLRGYVQQCRQWSTELGLADQLSISAFLALPGVVSDGLGNQEQSDEITAAVLEVVKQAAAKHQQMRKAEGVAMAQSLANSIAEIRKHGDAIAERSPAVVREHCERLENRIRQAFDTAQHTFQPADLLREMQVMADRLDIHEEVVRLRSHLEQFLGILNSSESQGRKLDFLIQEIFRETNTIGSKGSDVTIARHVIEMKTIIEQMRELVQNIE
jgi:uncharacterized protein (TIGR00255 family)